MTEFLKGYGPFYIAIAVVGFLSLVNMFQGEMLIAVWQLMTVLMTFMVVIYRKLTDRLLELAVDAIREWENYYLMGRMDERTGAPLREFDWSEIES